MKKIGSLASNRARRPPRPAAVLESVLYVEDDDDNWEIARLRLGNSYDLTRATNAEEACQILTLRASSCRRF